MPKTSRLKIVAKQFSQLTKGSNVIVLTYKEKKGDEEGGSEGRRKAERKKSSIPHLYFGSQNSFSILMIDTEAEPDE